MCVCVCVCVYAYICMHIYHIKYNHCIYMHTHNGDPFSLFAKLHACTCALFANIGQSA